MTGERAPERGFAVIVAMMGVLMLSALGMALVLGTSVETRIARNFGDGAGALYAAESAAVRAIEELADVADWTPVLSGTLTSTFVDGNPTGQRTLADRSVVDLGRIRSLATCGKLSACSTAEVTAITIERPWGANNPAWVPFSWGYIADFLPGWAEPPGFYALVLVGDDPGETDGVPGVDAPGPGPGAGVVQVRSEAFGPGGAHGVVELTVARRDAAELIEDPSLRPVRVVSWRAKR